MNDLERELRGLDVAWPATPDLATAVLTRIAAEPSEARHGEGAAGAARSGEAAGGEAGVGRRGEAGVGRRGEAAGGEAGVGRRGEAAGGAAGVGRRGEAAGGEAGVGRRGETADGGRGRLSRAPWRRLPAFDAGWRARVAYVAVAVVVLAGGTLAVSPDARSTVLRWLGLESVEIRREPLRPGVGRNLNLGDPIDVPPGTPVPRELGTPDAAYKTSMPDARFVTSLVYRGPPMVLVQTFEATATPFIEKTVGSADDVERLTIDGATAYWISGSHGFAFEGPNGVVYEGQRLSDRVLLVERGGRLYRVEGALSRDRAVEIYRSIE